MAVGSVHVACTCAVLVSLTWLSSCAVAPAVSPAVENILALRSFPFRVPCIVANCSKSIALCLLERECSEGLLCNVKCMSEKNPDACNILCEFGYGYNSTKYHQMVQCMATNQCFIKTAPDGKCLATDKDSVSNLTHVDQIEGKWWILKGLNCGQEGWPGGFDYFPCQRDQFVREGSRWLDRLAYCGGSNNTCTTPLMKMTANVSVVSPGVMTHRYLDSPLLPQTERWHILSWPHPDWMLYVYCGETPIGLYAGGSVVSNSSRSITNIPAYVEDIFIGVAKKFNFSYSEMCVTDATKCTD